MFTNFHSSVEASYLKLDSNFVIKAKYPYLDSIS